MLSLEPVTSPPRKTFRYHSKVLIVELDEEKKTHSKEMGGGNDEEIQATTTHANFKEEPNVNFH
jgi:hypothetical protein